MTIVDAALVLLAGVGAGAMNAVVGAGTLITFPTLVALGVPPVLANVSNTVGLVPGSVAGAYAFRATLTGRGTLLARLVTASAVGGVLGGALLLVLPPGAFELVVPVLLLLSGALAAAQPRVAAAVARRRAARVDADQGPRPRAAARAGPWLLAGVAATGVYGGYFGAAQGVILLALLGIFVEGEMTEVNGIKNVLAGVANLVSSLLFILIADVDWQLAGLVAVGATIGGTLGGRYGRRLPAGALRALVVAVAVLAAIWQFTR
ncbi:MAG: sulfite exporter TauE/SafE family protein [Actinomycetota bacterium]|nr:sulfite exporter TauE/SafE family protein [Actinomycetota bacterium]